MAAGVAEGAHLAVGAAHHDESACPRRRARCRSRPPAAPPTDRTASASGAARVRSPRRGAPSSGSWRPARARPPRRRRSCRWRCGRARAAPPTGHPLPLSSLPSVVVFLQAYARDRRPTKETASAWDELRSTVRSPLLGELAAQPALEDCAELDWPSPAADAPASSHPWRGSSERAGRRRPSARARRTAERAQAPRPPRFRRAAAPLSKLSTQIACFALAALTPAWRSQIGQASGKDTTWIIGARAMSAGWRSLSCWTMAGVATGVTCRSMRCWATRPGQLPSPARTPASNGSFSRSSSAVGILDRELDLGMARHEAGDARDQPGRDEASTRC